MANNRMAKAEREEFAALDRDGLLKRLDEEKKALWQARFTLGKRQLTDTAQIAEGRKRIARILTYLRQLELRQEAGN
jgi:ribosomal protein L29